MRGKQAVHSTSYRKELLHLGRLEHSLKGKASRGRHGPGGRRRTRLARLHSRKADKFGYAHGTNGRQLWHRLIHSVGRLHGVPILVAADAAEGDPTRSESRIDRAYGSQKRRPIAVE